MARYHQPWYEISMENITRKTMIVIMVGYTETKITTIKWNVEY